MKYRLEVYNEESNVVLLNDVLEGFDIIKPQYCDLFTSDSTKIGLYNTITKSGNDTQNYRYLDVFNNDEIVFSIYRDRGITLSLFYKKYSLRSRNIYDSTVFGLLKYADEICNILGVDGFSVPIEALKTGVGMKIYKGSSDKGYAEFGIGIDRVSDRQTGKPLFRIYCPGWRQNYFMKSNLSKTVGEGGMKKDSAFDNKILNSRFNSLLEKLLLIERVNNIQNRIIRFNYKKGKSFYCDLYGGIQEYISPGKIWQNMIRNQETFLKYIKINDKWYTCFAFMNKRFNKAELTEINNKIIEVLG